MAAATKDRHGGASSHPDKLKNASVTEVFNQVRKVLEEIKPMPVSVDELMTLTESPWSHRQIYDACKYGVTKGILVRDTSVTPTKFTLAENVAEEQLAAANPEEREKRKRGVLKRVVDYLAETGEHLTAEELVPKIGFMTTKDRLSANLSNANARGILSREHGNIPYKYYMPQKLREEWLAKRKPPLKLQQELSADENMEARLQQELARQREEIEQQLQAQLEERLATLRVAPEEQPLAAAAAEPQPEVAPQPAAAAGWNAQTARTAPAQPAGDFHAALGWDNQLTLSLDGQSKTISPELTLKLARLLRPLMNQ